MSLLLWFPLFVFIIVVFFFCLFLVQLFCVFIRPTHFTFYCIFNAFLSLSVSATSVPRAVALGQLWLFFLTRFSLSLARFWHFLFPCPLLFLFLRRFFVCFNWPWNNIFISFHFHFMPFPTVGTSTCHSYIIFFTHISSVYFLSLSTSSSWFAFQTLCFDFHLLLFPFPLFLFPSLNTWQNCVVFVPCSTAGGLDYMMHVSKKKLRR